MNRIGVCVIGLLCLSFFTLFSEVTVYGDLRTDLLGRSVDRSWTRTFVPKDFMNSETYPVPDDSGIETLLVLEAPVAVWLEKTLEVGTVFTQGNHVLIAYTLPETRLYRYMDKTKGIDVSFSLSRPSSSVFNQIAETYEFSEYWNDIVRDHYSENYIVKIFTYENVTNRESKTFSFDEAVIAASILADDDQWLWGVHNGCGVLSAIKKENDNSLSSSSSSSSSAGPLKQPEKNTIESNSMKSDLVITEEPEPLKIEITKSDDSVSLMPAKQPSTVETVKTPSVESVPELIKDMISVAEEKTEEPVKTQTVAVIPVTAKVESSINHGVVADYVLSEKGTHADIDGILASYGCSDFTIWAWEEFETSGIRSEVIIIEVPESDHYHAVCAYESEEDKWLYIDSDGYGDFSAELWQNIPSKIYNPDVSYDVLDVKTSVEQNEDIMFLEFMTMWK